ncbi:MAG: hypothetical protein LBB80_08030 [Treponema sp.]|nr:hypothetical protein [Treponema sp.]
MHGLVAPQVLIREAVIYLLDRPPGHGKGRFEPGICAEKAASLMFSCSQKPSRTLGQGMESRMYWAKQVLSRVRTC